uniref:hypothetical protein n=1 Tax=Salmonella enterica TaxID=28901 RepID=UPI00398C3978
LRTPIAADALVCSRRRTGRAKNTVRNLLGNVNVTNRPTGRAERELMEVNLASLTVMVLREGDFWLNA